jgi:hypothetical protein
MTCGDRISRSTPTRRVLPSNCIIGDVRRPSHPHLVQTGFTKGITPLRNRAIFRLVYKMRQRNCKCQSPDPETEGIPRPRQSFIEMSRKKVRFIISKGARQRGQLTLNVKPRQERVSGLAESVFQHCPLGLQVRRHPFPSGATNEPMRYKRKVLKRNTIGVVWAERYEGKVGETWIPLERRLNMGKIIWEVLRVRDRG